MVVENATINLILRIAARELGMWPIKQKVHYSKLMFYHHTHNSDKHRITKKIIDDQKERGEEHGF